MKVRTYFSPTGQTAMIHEINRQILEQKSKFMSDIDAVILWTLHTEYGFGKTRLKRFYDAVIQNYNEMCSFYEMDDTYLAVHNLREIGIDLDELRKGINNENQD